MIDLRRSGGPINGGDSFSVQIVGSRAHDAEQALCVEPAQSVFPGEESTLSYLYLSTSRTLVQSVLIKMTLLGQ